MAPPVARSTALIEDVNRRHWFNSIEAVMPGD
jgi:hypothetical protein